VQPAYAKPVSFLSFYYFRANTFGYLVRCQLFVVQGLFTLPDQQPQLQPPSKLKKEPGPPRQLWLSSTMMTMTQPFMFPPQRVEPPKSNF
jgi:hypothetical protein